MPCFVERRELCVFGEEGEECVEKEVACAVAGGEVGFWVAEGGDEEEAVGGGHSLVVYCTERGDRLAAG